jgi:hypothetical protein
VRGGTESRTRSTQSYGPVSCSSRVHWTSLSHPCSLHSPRRTFAIIRCQRATNRSYLQDRHRFCFWRGWTAFPHSGNSFFRWCWCSYWYVNLQPPSYNLSEGGARRSSSENFAPCKTSTTPWPLPPRTLLICNLHSRKSLYICLCSRWSHSRVRTLGPH